MTDRPDIADLLGYLADLDAAARDRKPEAYLTRWAREHPSRWCHIIRWTRLLVTRWADDRGLEVPHAAARAQVPVTIVSARAEQLPAPDDHFDGAVVSLVLCSFPEPGEALAELRRVVRPGGIVRFYEHVRSTRRAVGLMQDAITPVWSRLAGGCHLNRDAVAAVARAGLEVMEVDRFPFAGVSHVAGTAVVPDAGTPPSS